MGAFAFGCVLAKGMERLVQSLAVLREASLKVSAVSVL
jgi:hypothetical protein